MKKIKSTRSFENLTKHALKTKQFTKNIVIRAGDFSTYLSMFLANSRGKDKMLSLLQYLFQFLVTCGKYSNIDHLRLAYEEKSLMDMLIYYHLKENISSARKVFRLFRFFDEIKGLIKIVKTDKPMLFKLLSVFTYMCSCMYYVCDNVLWFVGILIKAKVFNKSVKKGWKYYKNSFSLCRIIAYLIILFYSIYLDKKQTKSLQELMVKVSKIQDDNTCTKELGEILIKTRRKIRFYYLEVFISLLRYIMLTSSLKLQWYEKLNPIFVATCGVFSSTLNFIKTIYEKKIIVNIEKQQTPVSIGKYESMVLIGSAADTL